MLAAPAFPQTHGDGTAGGGQATDDQAWRTWQETGQRAEKCSDTCPSRRFLKAFHVCTPYWLKNLFQLAAMKSPAGMRKLASQ